MKWVNAEAFDPKSITETTEPVSNRDRRLASQPAESSAWSVFAVRPDSPPRPLYNTTNRWLRDLTWDKDGVALQFSTRRVVTLAGSGDRATLDWQGKLTVDPATGVVREEFDAMPSTGGNDDPAHGLDDRGQTVTVQRDQANNQALLTIGTGYGPFRRIETVYLINKQGKGKRLEGMKDQLRSLDFLPSGGALRGYAAPPPNVAFRPSNDTYIIPTSDGQAIYLGGSPHWPEGQYAPGASKGSRMLILIPDPANATSRDSLMVVYNTTKHDLRILGKGPPLPPPNPNGFPAQVPITWPDGSNELAIGIGLGAVIVNATTGAMRPGQREELLQSASMPGPEIRSPKGRYTASVVNAPYAPPRPPTQECLGKPAGVVVTDKQTGEEKTLLECPGGSGGPLTWLDDNTLILTAYNCTACEPSATSLSLLDIRTSRTVPLTNGLEPDATAMPSPDHSRLLVTGDSLRVYDSNGTLLRDLGPAPSEGLKHTSLAWAPDSRSFAYILGPL